MSAYDESHHDTARIRRNDIIQVAQVARRPMVQQAIGGVGGGQQRLDMGNPGLVTAARFPDVLAPAVRVGDVTGGVGRSPRCRAVMRSWEPPRRAAGPVQNTMRETGPNP